MLAIQGRAFRGEDEGYFNQARIQGGGDPPKFLIVFYNQYIFQNAMQG